MSAEATGWVWRHSPYRGSELLVHLAIADVVNDAHDNEFFMSTEALSRKAKVSRSTVVATLRDMVDRAFLELLDAGGAQRRPSRYRFITSAVSDLASANRASPLARSARANSINPIEKPIGTSALTAHADSGCPQCQGRGSFYNAAGGFDVACPCTRSLRAVSE
jgi:predicted RNA-binding Zn ribbon-like protein